MHGLGDKGSSWHTLQGDISNVGVPIKWQFPDAPVAPVTCNDGYKMTSWFDAPYVFARLKCWYKV